MVMNAAVEPRPGASSSAADGERHARSATLLAVSTGTYQQYPPLSTAIHRKEKEAKRKEERPTTDFFSSSNVNDNSNGKENGSRNGQQRTTKTGHFYAA